ncbi:unnamed protein product [Rotaria sp. Silwood1]|nr:unnamed protein product [Rotaria sp. Silwood1]CAF4587015.1 unnamed protein product [Rotaria sp. Silwood1]CAF4610239.1 unnamed protein product [Rotaria sp. Silwood1]
MGEISAGSTPVEPQLTQQQAEWLWQSNPDPWATTETPEWSRQMRFYRDYGTRNYVGLCVGIWIVTETKDNVYAQCMFINVPIDWNEAITWAITNWTTCTETMQIFVKRYFLLGHENSSHHLWRIPGGGSLPIYVMENEAISIVATQHGLISVYATDKRSVGQSSLLECPSSIMSNFSACLSYIEQNRYRLKHNTFTNTVRDIQYVLDVIIGHNRHYLKSNQRVILMGSSQGTYLLQRYLHLTTNKQQVDAVILDSIVPTDIITLIEFDPYINYILLDLFSRCSQDKQECSDRFQIQIQCMHFIHIK